MRLSEAVFTDISAKLSNVGAGPKEQVVIMWVIE
jgi:hypothetical protein